MEQKKLGSNIEGYRKKKGLSQEKLAELFDVSPEELLGNSSSKVDTQKALTINKTRSRLFLILSWVILISYMILGVIWKKIHVGTLICMFVIVVPIQTFLHVYFSNVMETDSFVTIAGFDSHIEYDKSEVKNLLKNIEIVIGMCSSLYTFLLGTCSLMIEGMGWINEILLLMFIADFLGCILLINYKYIDKIYLHEHDKKIAKKGILLTIAYVILVMAGIAVTVYIFEAKGIQNNTVPAMKVSGAMILGETAVTLLYFFLSNRIKKENPVEK